MEIKTTKKFETVRLETLKPGDTFVMRNIFGEVEDFYIMIEPDYELDKDNGVYGVLLTNGELYRFDGDDMVIPVAFEATASF